jgi:hypothetical protein
VSAALCTPNPRRPKFSTRSWLPPLPATACRAKVEKNIKAKQEEMGATRKQVQEAQQKLAAAGGAGGAR